jgi:hypothetical protein
MNQTVIEESQKFVLYLENCDGNDWNSLMQQLSEIYQSRGGLLFFGLGFELCCVFAEKHFGQYWYSFCPQDLKYDFRLAQNSVILFAAAEILAGAGEEFKLGNLH